MAIIPVGELLPDVAALGNKGSLSIVNALPGVSSYRPFPSFVPVTDALDARPRGAIEAVDNDGNIFNYAGDATKLYQRAGKSWNDVSKMGGYSNGSADRWEFARWKNKVLATNFADDPQQITMGGANFTDLTTDFKARHIAIIREFVFFGNTDDGVDGEVRNRVRWSAFNDETDYTPDPTTGSDARDLTSGGAIQRIVGGEYGVIVSETSTFRVTWAGAPVWFQVDEVLPGVGTLCPGSVAQLGNTVFFISEQGFVALTGGTGAAYPGSGKVDRFIRNDLDISNAHRVSSVADPQSGRIFWAYPGSGNSDGRPNKIIVYDINLNRWGYAELETELLWRQSGVATSMEELDDFALGPNLVTNGTFDADSDWTKGDGWSIAGGEAVHSTGSAGDLSQDINIEEDAYYRVIFDVGGTTDGELTPSLGGTPGTPVDADDTDIRQSIQAGFGTDITFSADADFDGSLDNVEVRAIASLDDLNISLDSSQFKGGDPHLSAFDPEFRSGSFSGPPMTATIETRETELNAGHRTMLNAFRPLIDGGEVAAQVGTRNSQNDEVEWGPVLAQRPTGRFATRANARYHRFRLIASGEWKDAIGAQVEAPDARRVGRR